MNDLEEKIKSEAKGMLIRIVLFLLYYFVLILLGIGLFAIAGWVSLRLYNFVSDAGVVNIDIKLSTLIVMALFAMWLFCIEMGIYLIKPLFGLEDNKINSNPQITKKDSPELFAMIREIADATKNKMPQHVYLSPVVNASVSYSSSSLWSVFFPSGKDLTIGIGLLYGLNKSEIKAIIGHEFGHFSQETMRFAVMTFRLMQVVSALIDYAEQKEKDYAIARTSEDYHWYFHLARYPIKFVTKCTIIFYNSIVKKNSKLARMMEFEADNVACKIAGKDAKISSLCKLDPLITRFDIFTLVLKEILSNGVYLDCFAEGYRYCFDVLAEDEGLTVDNTITFHTPVGDAAVCKSRVKVVDGLDSHPSLLERIDNANQNPSNQDIDYEDARLLLSDEIINNVGLYYQQCLALGFDPPLNWNQLKPMQIDEFKKALQDYFVLHSLSYYISPFFNLPVESFDFPSDEELETEDIPYPFTNENRKLALEFAQAERDDELILNLHRNGGIESITYNGDEDVDMVTAQEIQDCYLSSLYPPLLELNVDIYKYLWKNGTDEERDIVKYVYWLLFYSNNWMKAMQPFYNQIAEIMATLDFYKKNDGQVELQKDYKIQISNEFRKFLSDFDFETISTLCGEWQVKENVTINQQLDEWKQYLSAKVSSYDGTMTYIKDVWDVLSFINSYAKAERKRLAICAYKGVPYEQGAQEE